MNNLKNQLPKFAFPAILVVAAFLALAMTVLDVPGALAAHGISIDGKLKYPPDFKQFDYTSSEARKGGTLVLHDLGR